MNKPTVSYEMLKSIVKIPIF